MNMDADTYRAYVIAMTLLAARATNPERRRYWEDRAFAAAQAR